MTVNRTTGQVTTVATLTGTTGASVSALAFSSTGVLFGSVLDEGASRTANLVTIDTITGQLTVVGPSVPGLDAIVFASPARAQAPDYRLVQMIVIPDRPLASYDISFVDPRTNTYYLADRSNARVDIFDAKNNRWVGSVGGFAGFTGNDDTSGPDGVAADGNRLYAGNGDSTLKVIDLDSLTIINSVNTGGSRRVGKMALDSAGHRLLVVNDADTPPFLTLISTKKGNPILFGPATVLGATARLGQPVWDPSTKRFYISVPELNGNAAHSGVAVFDPKTGTVESVFDIGPCGPSGLALGPHQHLLLGCAQEPSVVIDAKAGTIVANIPEVGGSDEVWFNPGDNRYYLAARNNPGGPFLGVVDADTNLFIQNVPTSTNSHSVAANPRTNDVYVPLTAGQTSPCPHGCIGVFADFSAD
jgi:WD40 repeat protein